MLCLPLKRYYFYRPIKGLDNCRLVFGERRGGASQNFGWVAVAHFLKPLPYFRPKNVIFLPNYDTLFQTVQIIQIIMLPAKNIQEAKLVEKP